MKNNIYSSDNNKNINNIKISNNNIDDDSLKKPALVHLCQNQVRSNPNNPERTGGVTWFMSSSRHCVITSVLRSGPPDFCGNYIVKRLTAPQFFIYDSFPLKHR